MSKKTTTAVACKVTRRKVPRRGVPSEQWAQKWFGAVQSKGQVKLDQLVDDIEELCTVTRHDIVAVLAAYTGACVSVLKNGDGVSFGELGTLYAHISSKTESSAGALSVAETVKKLYPHFTASKDIRTAVHRDKLTFSIFRG